jgi:hypothetical protein
MRVWIGLILAAVVLIFGSVLELAHLSDLIEGWMPKAWQPIIESKAGGITIMIVAWLSTAFIWVEHIRGHKHNGSSDEPSSSKNFASSTTGSIDNSSSAIGNKVELHQYFELPDELIDNLSTAIAEKLKTGDISGITAKDEADAIVTPLLSKDDGFIQLEGMNLEVTAKDLIVGGSVTAKYNYANRGILPVYEVQTWGLMQVLDSTKNSGPHLKAVMKVAAESGHRKFPGAATVGVQQEAHAFAPLHEPFTQVQLDALEKKSMSLFVLIGGVWVDNQRKAHFWAECRQAEFFQGLSWERFKWRSL